MAESSQIGVPHLEQTSPQGETHRYGGSGGSSGGSGRLHEPETTTTSTSTTSSTVQLMEQHGGSGGSGGSGLHSETAAPSSSHDEVGVVHPESTMPRYVEPVLSTSQPMLAAKTVHETGAPTLLPRASAAGQASTTALVVTASGLDDQHSSIFGSAASSLIFCMFGAVLFAGYRRLKGHLARRGYTNVRERGWQQVETVDEEFGLDAGPVVRRPPARSFDSTSPVPAAKVLGRGSGSTSDFVQVDTGLSSNLGMSFGEEESLEDFFTDGVGKASGGLDQSVEEINVPKPAAFGLGSELDDLFGNFPVTNEATASEVRVEGGELKF